MYKTLEDKLSCTPTLPRQALNIRVKGYTYVLTEDKGLRNVYEYKVLSAPRDIQNRSTGCEATGADENALGLAPAFQLWSNFDFGIGSGWSKVKFKNEFFFSKESLKFVYD